MAGTAPPADVWVVVEHPEGWGEAPLARAEHGVRVVLARAARGMPGAGGGRARVWVAHCADQHGPSLRVGLVAAPEEVAGWDLASLADGSHLQWGDPDPEPLLLVCANGRRDRCCGHLGGRLAEQLWARGQRERVLTCTHLGGHRFAPTALLLPWGLLHGRLDLATAAGLVAAAQQGWSPTPSLRGASALSAAAQVAEVHARRVSGYRGLGALDVALLAPKSRDRVDARVTLPSGRVLEVQLAREVPVLPVSCGQPPKATAHWVPVQ